MEEEKYGSQYCTLCDTRNNWGKAGQSSIYSYYLLPLLGIQEVAQPDTNLAKYFTLLKLVKQNSCFYLVKCLREIEIDTVQSLPLYQAIQDTIPVLEQLCQC